MDGKEDQNTGSGKHGETPVTDRLKEIDEERKALERERYTYIQKGLESDDPHEIMKAMDAVKIKENDNVDERKATFIDPYSAENTAFGYKTSMTSVTYGTLSGMAQNPVINAIIKTRKQQVANFSEPQDNPESAGWVIRKRGVSLNDKEELTKEDKNKIEEITEFIMRTGADDSWSRDSFEGFLRKVTSDSLVYDQDNWEVVRDRLGRLHEFVAVDPRTIRIADTYGDKEAEEGRSIPDREKIAGYYPSYVQVIQEKVIAEFYPWELCFGTRNPTTDIYNNGYGRSELEEMVNIVTALLWSDQYNRNFFRNGASPKGLLRVKGGANNPRLQSFKQYWKAMISGVDNAWRTPVIDSDEMEWVDLQKSHKDMEWGKWIDYLVKLACALYTIDPKEIGFDVSGRGTDGSGGGGIRNENEQRIKYSRDKGLRPLLKHHESNINKYVVSQIDPDFVFEFVGIDSESEEQKRTRLKEEVQHYKTVNEVRKEKGLEPLQKGGDIILSNIYTAYMQQEQMMEQQGEGEGGGMPSIPDLGAMSEGGNEKPEQPFGAGEEDPFAKAYEEMVDKIERGEL